MKRDFAGRKNLLSTKANNSVVSCGMADIRKQFR